MDSVVACCAGAPGSIPTVGEAKQKAMQMDFLLAQGGRLKMEPDMMKLHDLVSPCRKKLKILAMPSMGET